MSASSYNTEEVRRLVLKSRNLSEILGTVALILTALAVIEQLRKPAAERTWHGHLFGIIPYDFRLPTGERLYQTYWNPFNPDLFTQRVFGVGWGLNFGRLYRILQDVLSMGRG